MHENLAMSGEMFLSSKRINQTLALEGLNGPNANIDKFHITRTFINLWIPFGDHPLKLERYRED